MTGFGLLGHAFKLARASGVTAVIDHAAVPLIEGARAAQRAGYVPGGSRRNLAWVAPHADFGGLCDDELLMLADAQTSGGLLVAGEIPGAAVIGELVPRRDSVITVRSITRGSYVDVFVGTLHFTAAGGRRANYAGGCRRAARAESDASCGHQSAAATS